jgi:hypothetical protein
MKATRSEGFENIDVGMGVREFGRSGAMVISDEGEAKAIEEQYGRKATGQVVTMPVDDHFIEPGHTYQFTAIGVPWGKYDSLGRRVYDGEENQASVEGRADVSSHAGGQKDEGQEASQESIQS